MASVITDRRFGINSGIAIKVPVMCATTANITLSGLQTIDTSYTTVAGDRVLVKNQTDSTQNGIYIADTGSWTRDADFDGSYDVAQGTLVSVVNGTTNGGTIWKVTTASPTIGSAMAFALANDINIAANLAASSGSSLVGFIQAGANAVATTGQTKLRESYSSHDTNVTGDGVTDDTAAFQNANTDCIGLGKKLHVLAGTIKITAPILLNDTGLSKNYVWEGEGYGAVLKPTGFTTGSMVYINQTAAGVEVQTISQAQPRLIVRDLKIDGNASTTPSIFATNGRGLRIDGVFATGCANLVTTKNYTDMMRIYNVFWEDATAGRYMYEQATAGDNFHISNIECAPSSGCGVAWVQFANGGIIENVINGFIKIEHCRNISIRGLHNENIGADSVVLNNCHATLENSYITNQDATYYPVRIKSVQDIAQSIGSDIFITRNNFICNDGGTDQAKNSADIYLDLNSAVPSAYDNFELSLEANAALNYQAGATLTGVLGFGSAGIRIASSLASLQSFIDSTAKFYISSPLKSWIRYRAGAWDIEGDVWADDFSPSSTAFATNPTLITSGYTSTNIPSGQARRYIITCVAENGLTTGGVQSANVTTLAANQAIAMIVTNLAPKTMLRIWRDINTAGTWAAYVDIPVGKVNSIELVDTGNNIGGFTWITAGVPTAGAPSNYNAYDPAATGLINVAGRRYMRTKATGASTVSTFTGGRPGQKITLTHETANLTYSFAADGTTVANTLICHAHTGATWNATTGSVLTATYDGSNGVWYCTTTS